MKNATQRAIAAAAAAFCVWAVAGQAGAVTLRLNTEEYPPFNFTHPESKKIVGLSTEQVEEMMKRAGVDYKIEMLPWQRAYNQAKEEADTCVFSTGQTEERKDLFKWVGPLANPDWVFLARADSDITISSLDDAKKYKIGGYKGDMVAEYLTKQGIEVDAADRDILNARKLAGGRLDLWATVLQQGQYTAKEAGDAKLKPVFTFKSSATSLACNKGVDDAVIAKLSDALKAMQADGTVAGITDKYK